MSMNDSQHEALIAALHAVPAQPIEQPTSLTVLRPLLNGTMTISEALSPAVQAAIDRCEQDTYYQNQEGKRLCDRLQSLPPVPASEAVPGW